MAAQVAGLIRTWRERALLTQEQLAERACLSVRTVRRLESGRLHRPHGYSLQALAEALDLEEGERTRLANAARGDAREAPRPVAAAATVARQLPADAAAFAGRDRELAALDALLPDPADREPPVVIAALAGQAGVGKTALAVHWAHRVSDRFPDGQLHLDLRGYAPGPPLNAIQALSALLQGLCVDAGRVPVQLDAAAALFRSLTAGRRVLVVLDNARDAVQVRPLLPGGPGCAVVVTSRDRLDGLVASHGVRRIELDVLAPAEAEGLLAAILDDGRVAAEPGAAGRLAALCGHLPLALRITAAKLASGPDESIAAYADALAGGDRLAGLAVEDDPQAAVRNAFDWSYAALDPLAQRLLRLLGLLPGPTVDARAAGALSGLPAEQAGRLLARLAAAHLLERRGGGRYALHDLLRLYARERAREEDEGAALERLFDAYLVGADAAARELHSGRLRLPVEFAGTPPPPAPHFADAAAALAWLDAELANLVAAVQQAAEHGPRRHAWLLADALRGYFVLHRRHVDWLAVARASVAATATGGDVRARASALFGLGAAHYGVGRLDECVRQTTEALRLARRVDWPEAQTACLNTIGGASWALGDLAASAEHQAQAADVAREAGLTHSETFALVNLGITEHHLGRVTDAERHLEEALDRLRKLGDGSAENHVLTALADLRHDCGRYAEGIELARRAAAQAAETDQPLLEGEALTILGKLLLRHGDRAGAVEHQERALALACRAGARIFEGATLVALSTAQLHARPEVAREHAGRALAIARRDGCLLLEGDALTLLAAAHLAGGAVREAAGPAERAVALQRACGYPSGLARALVVLARARGEDEGAAHRREALALFAEIGAPAADEERALLCG